MCVYKKYACGVSRSERMGVLERGVPGTLEAGDGTGELVWDDEVSDAELLPMKITKNCNKGAGNRSVQACQTDQPAIRGFNPAWQYRY